MATDYGYLNYGTIYKFDRAEFLYLSLFLSYVTLNLAVVKHQPSFSYGANLWLLTLLCRDNDDERDNDDDFSSGSPVRVRVVERPDSFVRSTSKLWKST